MKPTRFASSDASSRTHWPRPAIYLLATVLTALTIVLRIEAFPQMRGPFLIVYMQKKGIKFKRIVTLWDAKADSKDSVNYASYAANRRAGMSSSKAAFKTWTGKRALEYGFDIVDDIDEDPDFVSISFSQSNPAPDKNASGCCGIQ